MQSHAKRPLLVFASLLALSAAAPAAALADAGACKVLSRAELSQVLDKAQLELGELSDNLYPLQIVLARPDGKSKVSSEQVELASSLDASRQSVDLEGAADASTRIVQVRKLLVGLESNYRSVLGDTKLGLSASTSNEVRRQIQAFLNTTHPALAHYNCVYQQKLEHQAFVQAVERASHAPFRELTPASDLPMAVDAAKECRQDSRPVCAAPSLMWAADEARAVAEQQRASALTSIQVVDAGAAPATQSGSADAGLRDASFHDATTH